MNRKVHLPQDDVSRMSEAFNREHNIKMESSCGSDHCHMGGEDATRQFATFLAVGPGTRLLELGSGLGGASRCLASDFGCEVTGLDASRDMVEEARRRIIQRCPQGKVVYHLGSAASIPFPPASYDVIWGQDTWYCYHDKVSVIRECRRVLRTSGIVGVADLFSTPRFRDCPWAVKETAGELQALFEANGFEVLSADNKKEMAISFCAHTHDETGVERLSSGFLEYWWVSFRLVAEPALPAAAGKPRR